MENQQPTVVVMHWKLDNVPRFLRLTKTTVSITIERLIVSLCLLIVVQWYSLLIKVECILL